VPHLRVLNPMTGEVIRSSKATAVRYEKDHPGELVHIDVKKRGKIPDGGGWRAHGRAAANPTKARTPRIGYDYVHSSVDDHRFSTLPPPSLPSGPARCLLRRFSSRQHPCTVTNLLTEYT
jgi:hypothetical protein